MRLLSLVALVTACNAPPAVRLSPASSDAGVRAGDLAMAPPSGLARGWSTWNDPYFGYGANAPVTFASVAGALSGEAVIGNIGAIADRLQVNPSTGAVTRIDNMKVVPNPALTPEEQQAQLVRE